MRRRLLIWLLLGLACLAPMAKADVAVLLEEPYSYDGALAGTGHAAIYLNRVCAASRTVLRHCLPGEPGVVIRRYQRVAGYDWLAIPLNPISTQLIELAMFRCLQIANWRRHYAIDIGASSRSVARTKRAWLKSPNSKPRKSRAPRKLPGIIFSPPPSWNWMNRVAQCCRFAQAPWSRPLESRETTSLTAPGHGQSFKSCWLPDCVRNSKAVALRKYRKPRFDATGSC